MPITNTPTQFKDPAALQAVIDIRLGDFKEAAENASKVQDETEAQVLSDFLSQLDL